jgi:hypothetical protein
MKKPKWCADSEWKLVRAKYERNGQMHCQHPGCTLSTSDTGVVFSLDHIISRFKGGTDEASNLQPMCRDCNARKNKFADKFWSRPTYFDKQIYTKSLRVSQNDFVYEPVMQNREFFSEPWSSINGKLFSYVQIVGAGKTLGIFSLPFALNQVAGGPAAGAPRVQRMLVVTKDQPLRAQIARELMEEPERFGIVNTAPVVLEIKSRDDITSVGGTDHDIAVMCPNMLWPQIDHEDSLKIKFDDAVLDSVLSRYQLIVFDEMHYAYGNISKFVRMASTALVFGFTASPMDSAGALLSDIVLMGQAYGYREAIIHDQSMKGISALPTGEVEPGKSRYANVTIISADEQVVDGVARNDTQLAGLPAVKSVCDCVCKELLEYDTNVHRQERVVSSHREIRGSSSSRKITVGNHFPPHAIIRVDDVDTANDVADYLNHKFNGNRGLFPKKMGWGAIVVDGSVKDFDSAHGFFRYKEKGYLDSHCIRIIVVIKRAIEGMNNKFLLVEGLAGRCDRDSRVKQVQMRGRLIRSTAYTEKDDTLVVPPRHFDQIKIITHEAFQNVTAIDDSLDFITNMNSAMNGVMTIDDYVNLDTDLSDDDDGNYRPSCAWETLVGIGQDVGEARINGRRVNVNTLVKKYAKNVNRTKEGYIRAIIQSAISNSSHPYQYKKDGVIEVGDASFTDLFLRRIFPALPDPLQIVSSEKIARKDMDAKACHEFMSSRTELAAAYGLYKSLLDNGHLSESKFVHIVNGIEITVQNVHTEAELNTKETAMGRVNSYVTELVAQLCNSDKDETRADFIQHRYHEAVAHVLSNQPGFTGMAALETDGSLCTPSVVQALRDDELKDRIRGWVLMEMLKAKLLSEIEILGVMS